MLNLRVSFRVNAARKKPLPRNSCSYFNFADKAAPCLINLTGKFTFDICMQHLRIQATITTIETCIGEGACQRPTNPQRSTTG